jgi:hypothetical protein
MARSGLSLIKPFSLLFSFLALAHGSGPSLIKPFRLLFGFGDFLT